MAGKIAAPDGREWTVRRRWAPRLGTDSAWGRFAGPFRWTFRRAKNAGRIGEGCLEFLGEAVLAGIFAALLILIFLFVALPLLVAIVDLLIILLLAALGILARVAFRRPWLVEARADDKTTHSWKIVGWRISGEKIEEVKQLIVSGIEPQSGT